MTAHSLAEGSVAVMAPKWASSVDRWVESEEVQ
jgi:hypothetical protein